MVSSAIHGSNLFQTERQAREVTAPGERFIAVAVREAKPGNTDALFAEIDALMKQARHAPGFVQIDVVQPFDEPSVFVHYEVWDSKQAHDAFDAGPVHALFAGRIPPLVAHHNIPVHYKVRSRYGAAWSAPPRTANRDSSEPRLPLIDPEQSGPRVRQVFGSLPASLSIFRAAANAESLFGPLMDTARTILGDDMALPLRIRELAILQVGQISGAAYEIAQHEPMARQAGATGQQIEALSRGDETAACFDEADRVALAFVREAVVNADVSDEIWFAAAVRFTARELTELLALTGFYRLMCTVMRAARLRVEAPINKTWPMTNEQGRAKGGP